MVNSHILVYDVEKCIGGINMELSARERMYLYIKENGPMATNMIAKFVAANPECVGMIKRLIDEGYVKEKND